MNFLEHLAHYWLWYLFGVIVVVSVIIGYNHDDPSQIRTSSEDEI